MMQVLVESRGAHQRRGSWALVSVAAHSGVIVAALALTANAPPPPRRVDEVRHVVYAPPPAASPSPAPIISKVAPTVARFRFSVPVIEPVNVAPPSLSFSSVIEEIRGSSVGSVFGSRPGMSMSPGGVHSPAQVDRLVAPLPGNPAPVYPARLAGARIEGDVLVRFVVDTTGRVEPQSIDILQSSHALFGESVRTWLLETRYSPALAHGAPVRQLVQQRVGFTLAR